jgi:hypothetical protein
VFQKDVIYSSIAVAFIAILETLISARLADEMTKSHHDRQGEVLGVSLANLASGLFGGIPATAALARTSLNVKAGATSRVSGITSSIWLYLLANVLLPYFEFVPMATVAGILFALALRLVETHAVMEIYKHDKVGVAILVLTALLCIIEGTMTALVVGSLLSMFVYLYASSKGYAELTLYNRGKAAADSRRKSETAASAAASFLSLPVPSFGMSPARGPPPASTIETTLVALVDVAALDAVYLHVLLDGLIEKFENSVVTGTAVEVTPGTAPLNVVANARHHHHVGSRHVLPLEDVGAPEAAAILQDCEVLFYRIAGQVRDNPSSIACSTLRLPVPATNQPCLPLRRISYLFVMGS